MEFGHTDPRLSRSTAPDLCRKILSRNRETPSVDLSEWESDLLKWPRDGTWRAKPGEYPSPIRLIASFMIGRCWLALTVRRRLDFLEW
jgi:hypothetical protein